MRIVTGRGNHRRVFNRCTADRVIAKRTARDLKVYLQIR